MTSETIADAPSLVARLDTDLITAQAIADHIAERFGLEDIAVSLSDAGGGRWQVAIHFRKRPSGSAVRDAVAAAAGAEAAAALQFGSVEAADWVRESLAGLQPVEAGRFVVHGAHDRARVPLQPHRHRDRSGARLRHRPPRHDARLPAGARCGLQIDAQAHAHTPASRRKRARILDSARARGVLAIAAARALQRARAGDRHRRLRREQPRAAMPSYNRAGSLLSVVMADGVGARDDPRARALRPRLRQYSARAAANASPRHCEGSPRPAAASCFRAYCRSQANAVIAAYRPLALERRLDIDGWTTLVLVRTRRC